MSARIAGASFTVWSVEHMAAVRESLAVKEKYTADDKTGADESRIQ